MLVRLRAVTAAIVTLVALFVILQSSGVACAQKLEFEYRPSPIDNPIRGLTPYASAMPWIDPYANAEQKTEYLEKYIAEVFPHSMEFHYFSMRELMPKKGVVDFAPIEKWLFQANSRGCQLTFRVFLEYPGRNEVTVPQFLIDDGLKITPWQNDDGQVIHAPDYSNSKLRAAIDFLIARLGEKYDGDPRVGCLTMGILGHWGEWHSYPRGELFPKKEYQLHVMDQFAKAFKKTPVLMRYPAGEDHWNIAHNANTRFGYHDDSFAWATVDTGKKDDSWFFMPSMKAAGAINAWKTRMIGGEIRPEVWGCVFDDNGCEIKGQEFDRCVDATHVSWLMDSGMFGEKGNPSEQRIKNATAKVGRMGYELFLSGAEVKTGPEKTQITFTIENRGVAPFYFDWPVEIAILDATGTRRSATEASWKLQEILPGVTATRMAELDSILAKDESLAIRIPNPMKGGKPIRFANHSQELDGEAWLMVK